jgi:hypothetical protein
VDFLSEIRHGLLQRVEGWPVHRNHRIHSPGDEERRLAQATCIRMPLVSTKR